jgi:hypothetical protein
MGNGSAIMSEADTARVRAVIGRLGIMRTHVKLGISLHVLEQARDFGRISRPSIAKVLEAIEREEAATANVA